MKIRIFFKNSETFPCDLVIETLHLINQMHYLLERDSLRDIRTEFPEVAQVAVDAALYRINDFRGSATSVQATRPGSLEVVVAASALAYWLLENTVGESMKEAWTKSDLHTRIRDFFLRGQKQKAEKMVSRLDGYEPQYSRVFREMAFRERRVQIQARASEDGHEVLVTVIDHQQEENITTYEGLEDEDRGRAPISKL